VTWLEPFTLGDGAEHRPLGDTTTLADQAVVEEITSRVESGRAED
jgi:hypothetical protein